VVIDSAPEVPENEHYAYSHGAAQLTVGGSVLLFLRRREDKQHYTVLEFALGAFHEGAKRTLVAQIDTPDFQGLEIRMPHLQGQRDTSQLMARDSQRFIGWLRDRVSGVKRRSDYLTPLTSEHLPARAAKRFPPTDGFPPGSGGGVPPPTGGYGGPGCCVKRDGFNSTLVNYVSAYTVLSGYGAVATSFTGWFSSQPAWNTALSYCVVAMGNYYGNWANHNCPSGGGAVMIASTVISGTHTFPGTIGTLYSIASVIWDCQEMYCLAGGSITAANVANHVIAGSVLQSLIGPSSSSTSLAGTTLSVVAPDSTDISNIGAMYPAK